MKRSLIAGSIVLIAVIIALPMSLRERREPSSVGNVLAVLPFAVGASPEHHLGKGLAEELITRLSAVEDLAVVSFGATRRYASDERPIAQVARELGADFVLTGTVRRSNGDISITAALDEVASRRPLFADSTHIAETQLFETLADIVKTVIHHLEVRAADAQQLQRVPTRDMAAYDLYLQGRDRYHERSIEDNEQATGLFRRAVSRDERFALAHAGVAEAFAQRPNTLGLAVTWADSALAAGQRALALDENLVEAHKAIATAHIVRGSLQDGLRAALAAVDLSANYAPAINTIAAAAVELGSFDIALPWLRKAAIVSPTSPIVCAAYGLSSFGVGDLEQARIWHERALALQPGFAEAEAGIGYIELAHGHPERAQEIAKRILDSDHRDYWGLHLAGDAALALGDNLGAYNHFQKLRAVSARPNPYTCKRAESGVGYALIKMNRVPEGGEFLRTRYHQNAVALGEGDKRFCLSYEMALAKAAMGVKAEAYQWLQVAIDAGWPFYAVARQDRMWESLHGEERFEAMMREVEASVAARRNSITFE